MYIYIYTYYIDNFTRIQTNMSLDTQRFRKPFHRLSPTPRDGASIFLHTRASPSLAASLPDLRDEITWASWFIYVQF